MKTTPVRIDSRAVYVTTAVKTVLQEAKFAKHEQMVRDLKRK